MKKIIISFIIVLAFTIFIIEKAHSQCGQQVVYACANEDEAVYLRDFNTKLGHTLVSNQAERKWTVVLNEGTNYRFRLCTPQEAKGEVILTLYNNPSSNNSSLCGSTYNIITKHDHRFFEFHCKKSGLYYVHISLKQNSKVKQTCAVGILSYIPDED